MKISELPKSTIVDRNIPKSKFYEKGGFTRRQQKEFVDRIQKIQWMHKLSEDTIGIPKTESVEEIQVFDVELKERIIPKNSLVLIERLIPYKILYRFLFRDHFCYGIHFQDTESHMYFLESPWDEEWEFDFTGYSLQSIYEKLVRRFLPYKNLESLPYNQAMQKFREIQKLSREIERLEKKVIREKQFNRQVEWNQLLREKRLELGRLVGEDYH
jgi:hypothetical protein